ncbi:hypothetical protein M2148_001686 [Lachnospiraceae bacterium PF1-4]
MVGFWNTKQIKETEQIMMCEECYSDNNRITPLLNPLDCLQNHTQYICGTCGRCICIDHDPKRSLQRWNFPFKSLDIAKLYLRTADYTTKSSCGIYEVKNSNGRVSFKIFQNRIDLQHYLEKDKGKTCATMEPLFQKPYQEFEHTEIRKLSPAEISQYMAER